MNWEKRVAKKMIAQLIQDEIDTYEKSQSDDDFFPNQIFSVSNCMRLNPKDTEKVVRELRKLQKQIEKGCDLTDRMAEWRECIE